MITNYLTIAWRTLIKNKAFSFINILGLALGMTCSLLIMLWVMDERNVDHFHENDTNLYSVFERQYHDGIINAGHMSPGILAEEMKIKLPEVQYSSSMAWNDLASFEANGKILKEEGNYASADFFKIFSYPLIEGDASVALKTPVSIAISRKMATDFFGTPANAVNKTIRYQNQKDFTVTAVFENIPFSSTNKFDFMLPWDTFLEGNSWAKDWGNNGPSTFLVLRPQTDVQAFRTKIKHFIELYHKEENFRIELDIQKYSDIYLHSKFENGELVGGRIQYVVLFTIIGVFILFIACVNFMNLSTARSIKRSKEIGIRKVVGAIRSSLIRQFLGEAMLLVSISFVIALAFVALILPMFNQITNKQVELPIADISFWAKVLFLTLITGLLAGSYPALFLSSFKPAGVLKGTFRFGNRALWFRKGLVVFQFALSLMLIVGTIVVSRQVDYVQSYNLGYERENLIYIPLEGDLKKKYDLFKDQVINLPGIRLVTRMTNSPTSINNSTGGVDWEGKDPSSSLQFVQSAIGYDFMKTMKIDLIAGRDFSNEYISDSTGYIVNESAVKIFDYKDPIGMPLTFWQKKGKIIGVMKDVHFNSLHSAISPLVLRLGEKENYGLALIRTEPGKTREALASLEKICKELNPQFPFSYQFSDQEYQKLYKSEQIVGKLSNAFAFLGIFISCLGLLGLAMFTTEQRTKEIGIRKVLGANIISLFNLLSKEILILVAVAFIIASPLAWFVMNNWLKEFAYRIQLSWWTFALAGFFAVAIALVTISYQTIKTLVANPVDSLRVEG